MSGNIGLQTEYRDKLDISQVFIRQLDRTNLSASYDEKIFHANILTVIDILPLTYLQWFKEQSDRYELKRKALKYKRNRGVKMGSADDPLLKDPEQPVRRFQDGSIDWSDPNIISPILVEEKIVDYHAMYQVALEAAQNAGLTWQIEKIEVDMGDTLEHILKIKKKRRKTPLLIPRPKEEKAKKNE